MSKEEVLAKNKLIAKFMYNDSFYETKDECYCEDKSGYIDFYIKNAKYHSSWNWLMPIIEKIESLGYTVKYLSTPTLSNRWYMYNMEIKKSYYDSVVKVESNYQNNESKLNTYYRGCIEFIKYYNKLNEAN